MLLNATIHAFPAPVPTPCILSAAACVFPSPASPCFPMSQPHLAVRFLLPPATATPVPAEAGVGASGGRDAGAPPALPVAVAVVAALRGAAWVRRIAPWPSRCHAF